MKRLVDLRVLFVVVAILELIYAAAAVLTPPSMVQSVTGWVLTADGQWLAKLMGVALASQAWIAWMFRHDPHLGMFLVVGIRAQRSAGDAVPTHL